MRRRAGMAILIVAVVFSISAHPAKHNRGPFQLPKDHQAIGLRVTQILSRSELRALPGNRANIVLTNHRVPGWPKRQIVAEDALILDFGGVHRDGPAVPNRHVLVFALKANDMLALSGVEELGTLEITSGSWWRRIPSASRLFN